MNVGNRKLFSNRDARSKLSSMGGIMASSPELMGEAQRFAEGSKDAVAANNGGTRLGTRMPVEESNELVKKIAEQSSRLGGFDESQGLTEGDLKSAITTVYFDSIRMIERLKRDPNLPASEVSDERLQSALMNRLTEMFGVDESIINETIAEVQPAAVDKNQAIPFAEQSPFRINPYRDFDKRSIADGIMSADPRRTRPSNEEVMALQGFTGTRAPVESPFGQESVDQLGAPSLLQQFRQTEMPSNRLGGSPDSEVLRAASPQGLGLESLDLVRPSGELSIDQMMNAASTRSAPAREGLETLSAPAAEFVPRFPGDTQFQQDMVARDATPPATPPAAVAGIETLGDVVAQNPQTANRQAALDKLKEQFSNMALFPDSAQRGENLSRFLDGAIDTPSGAVSASQSTDFPSGGPPSMGFPTALEQARLEKQFQSDGMLQSEDLLASQATGGEETPAEREARILAESMALIAERDPEAIARINAGTSISSRVNDIVEPGEGSSESEQLLASQQDAQRMMGINATPPAMSASDLARLANEGDERALNQIRLNEIAALSTASDMSLGESNPVLDSITRATIDAGPSDAAINSELTGTGVRPVSLSKIENTISELEEFLRLNPGNTQALASLKAAQEAITTVEPQEIGGYDEITLPSSPVDNKQLIERINAEGTSGTKVEPETAKEFRDKEADRVKAQGGLNSMAIVPDVTEKIKKDDGAGGAGTGTTLFAPSTVKDYQKMYADMLGGKDKDSAKDKWNDFAMIGFAIAAGQDPNALTNIAQGLLDGTKMMKEDRSIEQARQDKINMMAIESANQDRRAAIAAGASVTAANLAYERQVNLATTKFDRAKITAGNLAKANLEKAKATATKTGKIVGVASNPLSQVQTATASARDQDMPEALAQMAGYNELTNYSLAQMTEGAPQLLPQWRAMQSSIITTQEEVDALPNNSYFRTRDQTGNIVLRQK